jgi:hypothetical protein
MADAIIREADTIELIASRGHSRALKYRERAAQLRAMAETETVHRVRDNLLNLADQYDGLAARLG